MPTEQFIAFKVADKLCASRLDTIDEVADLLPVNRIGGTHSWFLGVAAKKGRLLPVSDLGEYADLPPSRNQPAAKLLLVTRAGETIGLTVDEVVGLSTADVSATPSGVVPEPVPEPAPDSPLSAIGTGHININGEMAIVLDLALLLEQDRFTAVEATN